LILESKITAQLDNHNASVPYTLKEIETVANNYFKCNKFTEIVFKPLNYQMDEDSDSDSEESSSDSNDDSEYDCKRRKQHRLKKKKAKHSRTKHSKVSESKTIQ
jgi:hypothetical protein